MSIRSHTAILGLVVSLAGLALVSSCITPSPSAEGEGVMHEETSAKPANETTRPRIAVCDLMDIGDCPTQSPGLTTPDQP